MRFTQSLTHGVSVPAHCYLRDKIFIYSNYYLQFMHVFVVGNNRQNHDVDEKCDIVSDKNPGFARGFPADRDWGTSYPQPSRNSGSAAGAYLSLIHI